MSQDNNSLSESIESIKDEILNQIESEKSNESETKKSWEDINNYEKDKLINTKEKKEDEFDYGLSSDVNNSKPNEKVNVEDKYGDDETYESWADNNLFFPIATRLVDPLRNLGLTPNMVTYLSTIFTFLSLYYFHIENRAYASITYLLGYTLDCVDGKMARKYNMSSKFGMALDLVSDNVSNIALIGYLIQKYGFGNYYVLLIIFMSYMISISYGLNEAIAAQKADGNDNFYERRKEELKKEKNIIFDLFLLVTKTAYQSYKTFFPKFDESKIFSWLKILKHFGPGNYCLLVSAILLYIE